MKVQTTKRLLIDGDKAYIVVATYINGQQFAQTVIKEGTLDEMRRFQNTSPVLDQEIGLWFVEYTRKGMKKWSVEVRATTEKEAIEVARFDDMYFDTVLVVRNLHVV